jgi:hypothetical protein
MLQLEEDATEEVYRLSLIIYRSFLISSLLVVGQLSHV